VIGGVLDSSGNLMGYTVARAAADSEHTGYIFELESLNADSRVDAALLLFAARQLANQKARIVRYHRLASPHSVSHEVLARLGFSKRTAQHQLLVRMGSTASAESLQRVENWRYSFGDAEASHSCC
jgi:hypothetical protein